MSLLLLTQQGTLQPYKPPIPPTPPEHGAGLRVGDHGCDVSSYHPYVDWSVYAATGRTFVFIKATEGTSYVNPYFARSWAASQAEGLVRGTYHFAQPDYNSPDAEVAWFLSKVPVEAGDMLALDLEAGSGDLLSWAIRFQNLVQERTNRRAYFYSGYWFMQPHN